MTDKCEACGKDLRAAYTEWGAENGVGERTLVSGGKWGEGLRARGCQREKRRTQGKVSAGWWGVGLQAVTDVTVLPEFQESPYAREIQEQLPEKLVTPVTLVTPGETVQLEGAEGVPF